MKLRQPSIGSVSNGTMRPEDLIPDFIWELNHRGGKQAAKHYQKRYDAILDEDGEIIEDNREDADYILESLLDALNNGLQPYVYFGSHPGDGSDYGYWVDFDSVERDSEDGCLDGRLEVNDHGNATLFYRNGRVAWAVV